MKKKYNFMARERRGGNRGEILIESIIFIVLNLVFLSILLVFLSNQSNSMSTSEDFYSKEVALLVDSAKVGMTIKVNLEDALKIAEKNKIDFKDIMKFTDNYVNIKLSKNVGHEYHYFNNVNVSSYPIKNNNKYTGIYILTINKK